MIDIQQAGRLLREDWRSPKKLAEELYSMLTSREPVTHEGPVTIKVPPGQIGLNIVRDRRPIAPPAATVRTSAQRPSPRDQPPETIRPPAARPDGGPDPSPASRRPSPSAPDHRHDDGPASARGGTGYTPSPGARGPLATTARRPDDSHAPLRVAAGQAYAAPLIRIEGPVSFAGTDAVQFNTTPEVWNDQKGEYVPMEFTPDFTDNPPLTQPPAGGGLLGKVTGGTGTSWDVTLYPDGPDEEAGDDVTVTILNIADDETAPEGQWIAGILKFGEDTYAYQPALWIGEASSGGGGGES